MCRYARAYKEKWACLKCRKSFKKISWAELHRPMPVAEDGRRLVLCPQCRSQMHNMGLDFKAPRQTDVEQWKKVEILLENSINYSSCGCQGPGPRPARLKDVPAFLEERRQDVVKNRRYVEITAKAAALKTRRRKRRKIVEDRRIARL